MDKKYKAVAITVTHKPVDEFDLVSHDHQPRWWFELAPRGHCCDSA